MFNDNVTTHHFDIFILRIEFDNDDQGSIQVIYKGEVVIDKNFEIVDDVFVMEIAEECMQLDRSKYNMSFRSLKEVFESLYCILSPIDSDDSNVRKNVDNILK